MTPFTNIYELALVTIQDYKLDYLAKNDLESFMVYLRGILLSVIPTFSGDCRQSLDYEENEDGEWAFSNTLTPSEQGILADTMVLKWFSRNTNDLTQINLHLQGRDKKNHAEATNLKEKSEYLDRLREKIKQAITDYQLEAENLVKIFEV